MNIAIYLDGNTYRIADLVTGDIVAVYNESGVKILTYSYDAWGNCTEKLLNIAGTNNFARSNPFRYRGYYLDTETGLYYVSSRYYDPEIGRFINADVTTYLGANNDLNSYNLYAYCGNNPVMRIDISGYVWREIITGKTNPVGEWIGNILDAISAIMESAAINCAKQAASVVSLPPIIGGSVYVHFQMD